MFEISIPQIKNCIGDLEVQEQEMKKLVERMDTVCVDFNGLVEDKSDKKALKALRDEMEEERRGIEVMKQTLSEILRCYEDTEKQIVSSQVAVQVRNQFGALDLSRVGQMLDSLNIIFK